MTHIVVAGTPLAGLAFYGPFESWADAQEFGENVLDGVEFWIAELNRHPDRPTLVVDNTKEPPDEQTHPGPVAG